MGMSHRFYGSADPLASLPAAALTKEQAQAELMHLLGLPTAPPDAPDGGGISFFKRQAFFVILRRRQQRVAELQQHINR